MANPKRVVILISGRGSNMQAIIEKSTQNYDVVAVVTNNPVAEGMRYALDHGVPVSVVERHSYPSLSEAKRAVLERIREHSPDIVALAGFMWVIPPEVVSALRGRLINIHPSLLPKYAGLDTHKRALEAKERIHGCTVHYVHEEVDGGPRIAQCEVDVLQNDSEETLAARVLEAEHKIYPWVIDSIASGLIRYNEGHVVVDPIARETAFARGITIPR